MICFTFFVKMSFPYWLWRQVIPYTWFQPRVYGGCDRSTEVAYSSAALEVTFLFEGLCFCAFDFVVAFRIMITFYTLLTSLFCIWITITNSALDSDTAIKYCFEIYNVEYFAYLFIFNIHEIKSLWEIMHTLDHLKL
jgi:hypothetical protein